MMWLLLAALMQPLPSLPRAISGQCAGVSNGALVVVGGSYFPVPLFEGGTKTWVDTIAVLTPGAREWKTFRAPRPVAYAACVTTREGLIIAGGGDALANFREVFRVHWSGSRIDVTPLPSLPEPVANASAALAGRTMYVVGGQGSPTASEAIKALWSLDLDGSGAKWQRLEDCPGAGRILPVAGVVNGALFVASGAQLSAGKRTYLRDAWQYKPGQGWKRAGDAPRAIVAAPVLAMNSTIYVLGGDDGANAARIQELKDAHPGFSRTILAWRPDAGTWRESGAYPAGLVTTMAVEWNGQVVIAGGEDRPGHRSDAVVSIPVEKLRP